MIDINGQAAIEFAGLAGELLLKNGAETSRVEDTITRICNGAGFSEIEVLVFPTGIIISGMCHGVRLTRAKRIHNRDINLKAVAAVNDVSRKFAGGKSSLEEGYLQLQQLAAAPPNKPGLLRLSLAGALASGAATLLLGGSLSDLAPAVIATALVRVITGTAAFNLAYVLQLYVAGLLSGLIGSLFVDINFGQHLDKIIVGALLPLVPGVAMTNAIRDFISRDLLSGTLRMVEALLIAASLAAGVGFAISIYKAYLRKLIPEVFLWF